MAALPTSSAMYLYGSQPLTSPSGASSSNNTKTRRCPRYKWPRGPHPKGPSASHRWHNHKSNNIRSKIFRRRQRPGLQPSSANPSANVRAHPSPQPRPRDLSTARVVNLAVSYNGKVQDIFDKLVRNISTARSNIRKSCKTDRISLSNSTSDGGNHRGLDRSRPLTTASTRRPENVQRRRHPEIQRFPLAHS